MNESGAHTAASLPRDIRSVAGQLSLLRGTVRTGHSSSSAGGTSLRLNPAGSAVAPLSSETCTSDESGRFELHGLANASVQLVAHFTPWYRETVTLPALPASTPPGATAGSNDTRTETTVVEEAPPLTVLAPGPCGADVHFVLPRGMTLAHFDLALRLGDAPWLRQEDKVAPLVDERDTMQLRGLPAAQCRLVVWRRGPFFSTPLAPPFSPPSRTFEFIPRAGAPALVRIDLTPLAENE